MSIFKQTLLWKYCSRNTLHKSLSLNLARWCEPQEDISIYYWWLLIWEEKKIHRLVASSLSLPPSSHRTQLKLTHVKISSIFSFQHIVPFNIAYRLPHVHLCSPSKKISKKKLCSFFTFASVMWHIDHPVGKANQEKMRICVIERNMTSNEIYGSSCDLLCVNTCVGSSNWIFESLISRTLGSMAL